MAAPPTPEQLLLRHLPFIERVARGAARRYGLRPEEGEEAVGELKLKLLADDYAVIRKFKGGSELTTYLHAVITHFMLDYRNHLWGKWRSTAEAKRLGATAVLLQRLLGRDGLSFEAALETLRTNYRVAESREQLEELAAKVRTTPRPRPAVGTDAVEIADPRERPDRGLHEEEEERERDRLGGMLRGVLGQLPAEDRVIVRMRVEDAFQVAEIARILGLEQRPLYDRVKAILKKLRGALEAQGVDGSVVRGLLDADEGGAPPALGWERPRGGPSKALKGVKE